MRTRIEKKENDYIGGRVVKKKKSRGEDKEKHMRKECDVSHVRFHGCVKVR